VGIGSGKIDIWPQGGNFRLATGEAMDAHENKRLRDQSRPEGVNAAR
jgi:hypothetical protein